MKEHNDYEYVVGSILSEEGVAPGADDYLYEASLFNDASNTYMHYAKLTSAAGGTTIPALLAASTDHAFRIPLSGTIRGSFNRDLIMPKLMFDTATTPNIFSIFYTDTTNYFFKHNRTEGKVTL